MIFKSQIGDGYFNLNLVPLYGVCARLIVQYLNVQIASMIHGHSKSSAPFVGPGAVTSSVNLCDQVFGCCVGMA